MIVVPPFLYGPLPPEIKFSSEEALGSYSTVGLFYTQVLKKPENVNALVQPNFPPPLTLDVRDAACAHVLALTAPLSSEPGVGRKRILMGGPHFTWRDATEHLTISHPELVAASRLRDIGTTERVRDLKIMRYDNSRLEELLGFKDFIPWEKTVDDAVDTLLEAERALCEHVKVSSIIYKIVDSI